MSLQPGPGELEAVNLGLQELGELGLLVLHRLGHDDRPGLELRNEPIIGHNPQNKVTLGALYRGGPR